MSCCDVTKWGCCRTKADRQVPKIAENRWCTDVIWLLLYILSWAVAGYVISMAKAQGGDPNKIIRGVDMNGHICGVDAPVIDKPLVAWPFPLDFNTRICVASCAHTNDDLPTPSERDMAWRYRTQEVVYYCLPVVVGNTSVSISVQGDLQDDFDQGVEAFSRAIGDVQSTYKTIGVSTLVALVVCFVFMFFLRYFAGTLVLMCITFIVSGCGIVGYLFMYVYLPVDPLDQFAAQKTDFYHYGGYVLWIGGGLFLVVVLALAYNILIAVEVIKEAARAITEMPLIALSPLLPLIGLLTYFVFWIYGALYIASVSELVTVATPAGALTHTFGWEPPTARIFPPIIGFPTVNPAQSKQFRIIDKDLRVMAGIWLFHLLWTLQFAFYFGYIVVAGAFADWYFTPRGPLGFKKRGKGEGALGRFPIMESFCRVVKYHMGTVALCAFIIAVVQFIRACILYLEKRTKSVNGTPNALQKALFCAIQCCLWLVECCLNKINKNALIWTAIYGDGYCVAACSAFALMWRNLFRVAAIGVVSTIIFAIGKVSCAIITAGLFGYAFISVEAYRQAVTNPMAPTSLIFVIAYAIATLFFTVFDTIVDTTFFCFLVDSENNEKGQMMSSVGLQKLVGKYEKDSKEKAKLIKNKVKGKDRTQSDTDSKDEQSSDDDLEMADL